MVYLIYLSGYLCIQYVVCDLHIDKVDAKLRSYGSSFKCYALFNEMIILQCVSKSDLSSCH